MDARTASSRSSHCGRRRASGRTRISRADRGAGQGSAAWLRPSRSHVPPTVGQVLIDAPPRNVGSTALFAEVDRALAELREGRARVVVVGSAVPGYFVAHGSLTEIVAMFGEGRFGDEPNAHARVLRELDRGAMVSIAAVDGRATWIASRPPWAPTSNKALVKAARDTPLRDALRHELATFAEHCARPDALELIRAAQSRYDAGGDSYDAFGLPRP